MDDIITFSKTIIINILLNANMKISIQKSKFFKLETTFLGYFVSRNVIKTDPEKKSTILKYPIPKNFREPRSFLGLTGYHRKFVQKYSKIEKPLRKYLEGQNGKVSKKMSRITSL